MQDMKGKLVKIGDHIAVATDRSPLQCGCTGVVRAVGEQLKVWTGSKTLLVPAGDCSLRPEEGWRKLPKPKGLQSLSGMERVKWLSGPSMQTHAVELLETDTLQHRHKQLADRKLEHEMEIPFLEIFWKFLLWSLGLAEKSPVQMMHPCRVKHAIGECGGGHDAVVIRDIGVQMCEEGGLVLLPMSLAGHWTLLAIDVELREVRFTDTCS